MATWIVHLRIAENLLEMIPGLDAEQFVIGNIAPDSGIPDEKWEKFTPPSEVTHFKEPNVSLYPSADLVFYHRYLAYLAWPGTETKQYSFLVGYFYHLVADNLWKVMIGDPTFERFKAQFEADRRFIWEVKKDWYGLDFVYVRSHPDSIFWRTFLGCEYIANYLEFLAPEGIRRNMDHIKAYYQSQDANSDELCSREWVYLTEAEMNQFVEAATVRIYRAWKQLQDGALPLTGRYSVLENPADAA